MFVLDMNCFHRFFDPKNRDHEEFEPLVKWLYDNPRTCLVYGGNHYRRELNKVSKYHDFLLELRRARKIAHVCDVLVDKEEERLNRQVMDRKFNDGHIIAIFCVSGCRIFASWDKKADYYITNKQLYPKHQKCPSIYRSKKHAHLLCNQNIISLRNINN